MKEILGEFATSRLWKLDPRLQMFSSKFPIRVSFHPLGNVGGVLRHSVKERS
jgi:hypothetical protein